MRGGINVLNTFNDKDFRSITQKIYLQLPDENKCEKNTGGITNNDDVFFDAYTRTLRGYISTIREEIARKIPHPLTAQQFAIEGFKEEEFGIQQSTPELRAQIKKAFNL